MKVVINVSIGGFTLTRAALDALRALGNVAAEQYVAEGEAYEDGVVSEVTERPESCYPDIERHDPQLVEVVERLGEEAGGSHCRLKVVEIPDGVEYSICDNEMGCEWVAEKHRTWS